MDFRAEIIAKHILIVGMTRADAERMGGEIFCAIGAGERDRHHIRNFHVGVRLDIETRPGVARIASFGASYGIARLNEFHRWIGGENWPIGLADEVKHGDPFTQQTITMIPPCGHRVGPK